MLEKNEYFKFILVTCLFFTGFISVASASDDIWFIDGTLLPLQSKHFPVEIDNNGDVIHAIKAGIIDEYDYKLYKYNKESGNIVWEIISPAIISNYYINDISIDSSNNIILSGVKQNTDNDAWISKLNSDGIEQWQLSVDNDNDYMWKVTTDGEDNIISVSNIGGIHIHKYNQDGGYIWDTVIENPGGAYDLCVDEAGNIYLCGRFTETDEIFIAKYDPNGVPVELIQETGYYSIKSMEFYDGHIYTLVSADISESAQYIRVYDEDLGFVRSFMVTEGSKFNDMTLDIWGNIVLTGMRDNQIFTVRYDSSGEPLWAKFYDREDQNGYGRNVATDFRGNIVVAGYFDWSGANNPFVMKYPVQPKGEGGDTAVLESEIAVLTQKLATIESWQAVVDQHIVESEAQIFQMNLDLVDNSGRLTQVESSLSSINVRLTQLEEDVSNLDSSALLTELDNMNQLIAQNIQQIVDLQAEVQGLYDEIAALNPGSCQCDEAIAGLETRMLLLETGLSLVELDLAGLDVDVQTLESRMDSSDNRVGLLEEEVGSIWAFIESLNLDIVETVTDAVIELQSDVEHIKEILMRLPRGLIKPRDSK